MKFLRILLFPLSFFYGVIIFFRNKFYDLGILDITTFNIPLISVGNLTTGGTGKTPHIEYLIRSLKTEYSIATLSRGYGRKSSGFILVSETATSTEVGDEPLQFKTKFKDIIVTVEKRRVEGVKRLLQLFPKLNVILLDDAFQHRALKAGISILLTEYGRLFNKDYILPAGNLREFRSGHKRADIIIITKTPKIFPLSLREKIIKEISPSAHQKIYFSYIKYGNIIPFSIKENNSLNKEYFLEKNSEIALLTGIANTAPLEEYLKEKTKKIHAFRYPDHHEYTVSDLIDFRKKFDSIISENKIVLTTEKDVMRLNKLELWEMLKELPLFYIPIEIEFHNNDKKDFDKQIINYVRKN